MSLIKPLVDEYRASLESRRAFLELKRINGVLQTLNVGNEAIYTHQGQVLELLRTHNLSPMTLGFEHRDTPSLEGLAALIRKGLQSLVSSHEKPGVLIDRRRRNQQVLAAVADAVKNKYTNQIWLGKQTLVEGDISGQGIVKQLTIAGKFQENFSAGIKQSTDQLLTLERQYGSGVNAYVKDLERIHKETKRHAKDSDTLDDYLRNTALKELQSLKTPSERANMVGKSFNFLDNATVTFNKDWVSHKDPSVDGPEKIRPLTMAEIPVAAELLHQILKDYMGRHWAYFSPPLDHEDSSDPVVRLYEGTAYADDYYDYMEWGPFDEYWTDALVIVAHSYYDVAAALEQWIDRSIK